MNPSRLTQRGQHRAASGTTGGRRRGALAAIAALAASSFLVVGAVTAQAAVTADFELDGNLTHQTKTDWADIFNADTTQKSPLPTGFTDAGFKVDYPAGGGTSDDSTFSAAKDIDEISGWRCVGASNVTDKGDIQNAYSTVFTNTAGDTVLYFGMEKNAPNGDNNMGLWLLQDQNVACSNPKSTGPGVAFSGAHVNGDVLLVAAFTNGGASASVIAYTWQNGALVLKDSGGKCGDSGSDNLCAITNATDAVTTPWLTQNKTSNKSLVLGNTLNAQQFFEGAVNLTAEGLDRDASGNLICINKFIFDTRASQSTTSSLYDYAEGDINTCVQPSITTTLMKDNPDPAADTSLAPPNQRVLIPTAVYDTAVLSGARGTPSGTVTYKVWTNNDCTGAANLFQGGTTNTNTKTIASDGTIPPSDSITFSSAGTWYFSASYSGGGHNQATESVCDAEPLTVAPNPTIATSPSASVVIGGSPAATIHDVATINGGYFPVGGPSVGTVTFKLYGPFASNATITSTSCDDTPTTGNLLYTDPNVAAARTDGTTATATSGNYAPTAVGKYQWVASYSGNADNNAVAGVCGDASEQVTVTPSQAHLSTAQTWVPNDGMTVTASANTGALAGTAYFTLYPSSDCTGTSIYSKSFAVSGSSPQTVSTDNATAVTTTGNYSWKVRYDSTNSSQTGIANSCHETSAITITNGGTIPSP